MARRDQQPGRWRCSRYQPLKSFKNDSFFRRVSAGRKDQGRIFGAWPGAGSVYRAQLLEPVSPSYNPLEDFVFNDSGDALTMRRSLSD